METEPHPSTHKPSDPALSGNRRAARGRNLKPLLGIGVAALVAAGAWIVLRNSSARAAVAAPAVTTVGAALVAREDLFNDLEIYGEFRPYAEVELHAKVSGFLDQMKVDFGDKVKAGQLLATIEVPELRDQLRNAVALRERADVDYTNADQIYNRLKTVRTANTNLVALQELESAEARDGGARAALAAARAEEDRFETLTNYTRITAPFDGVITRRYADPGALIQAGTASDQSLPLVRVSDNYRLRMDFPVSVRYVKDIHLGGAVSVRVDSLNGRTFTGKITRFSNRVDDSTRDMTTEIEVANPDLEIVPGMYVAVALQIERRANVLAVPTEAVGGGSESSVYVINGAGEIESRPVHLGLETPGKYEVTSGLKEGERVMIGNRSLVHPGQKVEFKLIKSLAD